MVSKVGFYAYGIVGKSTKQLDILGIDQKNKVYPVEKGDICVVVSKIDTDKFQDEIKKLLSKLTKTPGAVPSETEEILRGHEDVLDTLMKLTPVVPFKFGTILKDEEAVSKMLREYEEKFKKLLSKFTGKEEWGIKVYTDSQKFKNYLIKRDQKLKELAYFRAPARKQGAPYPLGQGRTYLLGRKIEEKIEEEMTRRLSEIAEIIFRQAERLVFEARRGKTLPRKLTGKEKEMILNCACLLEKERVGSFHKQIKTFIEKYQSQGVDLEISGPWPPYSFVSN